MGRLCAAMIRRASVGCISTGPSHKVCKGRYAAAYLDIMGLTYSGEVPTFFFIKIKLSNSPRD